MPYFFCPLKRDINRCRANTCPRPPYFIEGLALQEAKSILDYHPNPHPSFHDDSSRGGDGGDGQSWRFGGRHGQKRTMKPKNKRYVRMGKFNFCVLCVRGWRPARREARGLKPTEFLCKKGKFCTGRIFVPFKGTKKFAAFYDESAINAHCFPCQCIPYRPIPIKVMINMIRDCP